MPRAKQIFPIAIGQMCNRLLSLALRPFGLHRNIFTFKSRPLYRLVLWYELSKKMSIQQMPRKASLMYTRCYTASQRAVAIQRITRRLERARDPWDHFTAVGRSIAESG
jgi:hypothetical protein